MRGAWTHDDIELLKKLWAEGVTAEAIAARLGARPGDISRSAVLGKVFRLRLGPAPGGAKPKAKAAGKAAPVARRRGVALAPPPKARPEPKSKSLFDLTNNCCRWPYRRPGAERYFFCGVAEADLEQGKPYCDRHMKRAYLVAPRLGLPASVKNARAA